LATVNIGNLTFTHKGDYASGTQYVKNDVVYYSTNGNAYIAKQTTTGNAPTNGTYWSQFAAGSGGIWNAGLSLGSAGQVVKVNSGASALEFGSIDAGSHTKIAEFTSSGTPTYWALDNIFSSTYDFYMIYLTNYGHVSNNLQWYMRFRTGGSSGAEYNAGAYRYMVNYIQRDSGSETNANDGAWDTSMYKIANFDLSADADKHCFAQVFIAKPYNDDQQSSIMHNAMVSGTDLTRVAQSRGSCIISNSTRHTGVSFSAQDSANKIRNGNKAFVYGIKY
jgi:hypothetical protein|tara:strand:- start:4771 stop:5604 length:834 start_codon:yes stop_codon:yes gene_type:complete